MPYNNPKELLIAATALPAKIEGYLPAGAPALSTMLVDAAEKMPVLPDFPMALPDLPPLPEGPTPPGGEGAGLGRRRFVTGVTVTPAPPAPAVPRAPGVARSTRYLF